MVSANRFEKNCVRAIIALDELYSKKKISKSRKVKITGLEKPNFRYKIKNTSQFDFLGYIEESELEKLYTNCGCLIYPSLNEGFGYPPLEAMKYGVPVLASNAASIPEVCGEAALYFKPTSIKEIKSSILDVLNGNFHSNLTDLEKNRFKKIEAKQNDDLYNLIDWILAHCE